MGWGNVIACPQRWPPKEPPLPAFTPVSSPLSWNLGRLSSLFLVDMTQWRWCSLTSGAQSPGALCSFSLGLLGYWFLASSLLESSCPAGWCQNPEGAHMKVLWLTAPAELFADSQRWLLAICVMWPSSPAELSEACSLGCSFLVSPQETPGEDCPAEPRWPTEPWGRILHCFQPLSFGVVGHVAYR